MDTLFHHWLRPTLRARRAVASIVVVALLGWVSLTARHVHLDAFAAAHVHQHGHAGDGHVHALGGAPDGAGERNHPCSLCASFERAAGPAALLEVPFVDDAARSLATPPPERRPRARAATPYRSRAPPHA